ncbi:MAG: transposase, partial [Treponema sp.]|nr:transposase [Treponema sp.]
MAQQDKITLLQFQKVYKNEALCREHMFQIRWPSGFVCPHCGHTE